MKAALISLGSKSSKWTSEAMKKYFSEVEALDLRNIEVDLGSKNAVILNEGNTLAKYDCIYLKGSFRYVQLLKSIASVLSDKVYNPISANAFTVGHDKLLTHLALAQAKIPMPETYISANPTAAKLILEKLNYPIVMKFPHGTQGKGVMFADSFSSASSMLDALSALNQPVIIQQYIETGGADIRIIVVGNKIAGSMKRQADEGQKRANIHAGGKGVPVKIDYRTKQIALKTAEVLGAEICAVDILESVKGPLVIEINLSPGLQGITEATKVDVADQIAKYLYEQTKLKKEEETTTETDKIMAELDIDNLSGTTKTVISTIEMRNDRILLPAFCTELSEFKEGTEINISLDKNLISITKSQKPKKNKTKIKKKK